MPLLTNIPSSAVGNYRYASLSPPVACVGYVYWNSVIDALKDGDLVKLKEIVLNGEYHPIGYLEVGATISVEPREQPLPIIEGETTQSHQSQLWQGLQLSISCKINLFYQVISLVSKLFPILSNRGGYIRDAPFPLALFYGDIIGYLTHMLARNPIVLEGIMPVFAIAHRGATEEPAYEYFIVLNARMSMPGQVFPLGGSPTTMSVEVYTNGTGIMFTNHPKVGDTIVGDSGSSQNILDFSSLDWLFTQDKVNSYLTSGTPENAVINTAIIPSAKVHSMDSGSTGQVIYNAKAPPTTILAIYGIAGDDVALSSYKLFALA